MPVHHATLHQLTIFDAAIARFQQFSLLEGELKRARNQLVERKLIDKAKGIIMRQRGAVKRSPIAPCANWLWTPIKSWSMWRAASSMPPVC